MRQQRETLREVGEKKQLNLCLAACESAALLDCSSPSPCSALLALPPAPKQAEVPAVPVSGGSVEGRLCLAGSGMAWCGAAHLPISSPPGPEELFVVQAASHNTHFPPVSPQVRCCCSQISISRMRTVTGARRVTAGSPSSLGRAERGSVPGRMALTFL